MIAATEGKFQRIRKSKAVQNARKSARGKKAPLAAIESVKSLREHFKHGAPDDEKWAQMRPLD